MMIRRIRQCSGVPLLAELGRQPRRAGRRCALAPPPGATSGCHARWSTTASFSSSRCWCAELTCRNTRRSTRSARLVQLSCTAGYRHRNDLAAARRAGTIALQRRRPEAAMPHTRRGSAAARQSGERAVAHVASVQDQPVMGLGSIGIRHRCQQLLLHCPAVLPGANPVRLATRNTCVSTAIVGSPNATLSTTLARLAVRPPATPRAASRSRGTWPSWRAGADAARLRSGAWPWCGQADAAGWLAQRCFAHRKHRLRRRRQRE